MSCPECGQFLALRGDNENENEKKGKKKEILKIIPLTRVASRGHRPISLVRNTCRTRANGLSIVCETVRIIYEQHSIKWNMRSISIDPGVSRSLQSWVSATDCRTHSWRACNNYQSLTFVIGASPRQVDALLGSTHARNYAGCMKAEWDRKCKTALPTET